ncbi:hypothetical protein C4J99_0354 [Pseudomonas synxantha]|nr:hypothetical protein C4K01_0327 [Pseudomonas synxantha]AZE76169.1 hypothetical protein C4J99_0354 [Pseudomonas synxantha]
MKQPNSPENIELQKHQSPVIRRFGLSEDIIWHKSTTLARPLQ